MSRQGFHRAFRGLAIAAALTLTAADREAAAWPVPANPAAGWSGAWSRLETWWEGFLIRAGSAPSVNLSRSGTKTPPGGAARKADPQEGTPPRHCDGQAAPCSEGGCTVNPNGNCSIEH